MFDRFRCPNSNVLPDVWKSAVEIQWLSGNLTSINFGSPFPPLFTSNGGWSYHSSIALRLFRLLNCLGPSSCRSSKWFLMRGFDLCQDVANEVRMDRTHTSHHLLSSRCTMLSEPMSRQRGSPLRFACLISHHAVSPVLHSTLHSDYCWLLSFRPLPYCHCLKIINLHKIA